MCICKGLDRYKGLGRQSGGDLKTKILRLPQVDVIQAILLMECEMYMYVYL